MSLKFPMNVNNNNNIYTVVSVKLKDRPLFEHRKD